MKTAKRRPLTPAEDALLRSIVLPDLLRDKYPEMLRQVPHDLRQRVQEGDPSVWADLLRRKPELFRHHPFCCVEDVAFNFLLGKLRMEPGSAAPTAAA